MLLKIFFRQLEKTTIRRNKDNGKIELRIYKDNKEWWSKETRFWKMSLDVRI